MSDGSLPGVGIAKPLTSPTVVERPIWLLPDSVNHSASSRPTPMAEGPSPVGPNSVMTPAVVIRPILSAPDSVNHNAPPGPTMIPEGSAPGVGTGNSVIAPAAVIRQIGRAHV